MVVLVNVTHMNPGNGETSYANNSTSQKIAILKTRPVLEETLKNLYRDHGLSECLKIADLGCSSGPNTFLAVSEIIETIDGLSLENGRKAPELQIFLNDLPGNDFNSIFKSLPEFYRKLKEESGNKNLGLNCFVSGVPGSFYGRLFPSKSLHFVHSSYSVHWLSQVPEGLENKGNICIARTSPPQVFEAYLKQFQRDFSTFLSLRSKEMVPCGHMLLTLVGRKLADHTSKDCFNVWELLNKSLLDMVSEQGEKHALEPRIALAEHIFLAKTKGLNMLNKVFSKCNRLQSTNHRRLRVSKANCTMGLIQEKDLDSFNFPFFLPYKGEVEAIIRKEGSFHLERLYVSESNLDPNYVDDANSVIDSNKSGETMAKILRAISEPMVAGHFGEFIVEDLFKKVAKHVADHLCLGKVIKNINIVVSISRKS